MSVTTTARELTRDMVALNADVVGYSRLMADDLEAITATMEEYHLLVERLVRESGGKVVAFVGDNFMAVFEEPMRALRAAIAIATDIESRTGEEAAHRAVRFRMGIDQGRVTVTPDGQYFGEALNVAARIQAIAQPGGISISSSVYRALDEPELRFKSIGSQTLKNIPGTTVVYEFLDLPAGPKERTKRLGLGSPTVAVLPVHTDDLDDDMKGIGPLLKADIVHRLASIPGLHVVDATASGAERAGSTVEYMLESGIHQFRDTVRAYAKLVDVATINIVFSHRWDSTSGEVLGLSEHMADDIARSLEIELVVGEPARIYAEIADVAAQEHIYKGWFHLTADTREGWEQAVRHFSEVVASHPDVTTGYALLAFAHWVGAAERLSDDPTQHLAIATELAKRGIEKGDPTGLSQMVEAASLLSEGKADAALERLDGVEITRPTCDVTFALEGSVRRYLGQWQQSVALIDQAMRLTHVTKPWYPTVQACSLFLGQRYEDAASTAEAVLEFRPNNLEALLVLAASQRELGLDRRAAATAEVVRDRFPAVDIGAWLDASPYQDTSVVERWRTDLADLGLIE